MHHVHRNISIIPQLPSLSLASTLKRPLRPAIRPKLSLPSKEVQNSRQRLPEKAKRQPEYQIACRFTIATLHFREWICQPDEWDLPQHAEESDTKDVVRWYTDEELVKKSREDEGDQLGKRLWNTSRDHWGVNVAFHEVRDRLVPARPIRSEIAAVPPVAVEFAVAEVHHLGQEVEKGLEDGEEAREPAHKADC